MLLAHYFPKILTALLGGLFIFASIYSFGNALIFDRLYIGVLIFTAIICRKNVNVFGVIVILLFISAVNEIAWVVSEIEYKTFIKILFYAIGLIIYMVVRYDKVSNLLALSLLLCFCSESYWIIVDRNPPELYWVIFIQASHLLTRHLLFYRVSYTADYYRDEAKSIDLDWHIFKLNTVAIVIHTLTVIEYIIRNVFGQVEVMFIYNLYPYLMHALAAYYIWIIFQESYKLLIPKLLRT
jgi:hypothetical protein